LKTAAFVNIVIDCITYRLILLSKWESELSLVLLCFKVWVLDVIISLV